MIVEMHSHTSEHSSCSHVAAVDLAQRACEVGIQTIVLTDHHYQWSEEELADLRKRTGLPNGFQILAGQEVDAGGFGHVLIYGARATISKPGIPLRQIREENPDAAIIWAHPYRDKRIPAPERLLDPLIDGIEIFSSNYTANEAARALQAYFQHAEGLEEDFPAQVNLYKARTCLSILYYLAKINLGESENFWRILVEAERSLAYVATKGLNVST